MAFEFRVKFRIDLNNGAYVKTYNIGEARKSIQRFHRAGFTVSLYDDNTERLMAGPFKPNEKLPGYII